MTQPRKSDSLARNPVRKFASELEPGDGLETHPGVFWDVVSIAENSANSKTLRVELVHGRRLLLGPSSIVTVLK